MSLTMARRRVSFQVLGIAQPKGSTRSFVPKKWAVDAVKEGRAPHTVTTSANPRVALWQQLVSEQAATVAQDGLFVGPVVLTVSFHLPRPASLPRRQVHHVKKPDLDKLTRAAKDALKGVLYNDDSQVSEMHLRKVYAAVAATPMARITVEEACDPDPLQLDWVGDGSLFT